MIYELLLAVSMQYTTLTAINKTLLAAVSMFWVFDK